MYKKLTIKQLLATDFNQLNIDTKWNYKDKAESKMHQIHTYPAKFPAFVTQKALKITKENGFTVNIIADIFCGCGTTAYEASCNNKEFWGCDINPVATLIAKTKSDTYKLTMLDAYFAKITHKFNTSKITPININPRIKYWFKSEQINELHKLKIAIYNAIPANSKYKKFFVCAFSNILKPTSNWLQKSIKPTVDANKIVADVWQAYIKQFNKMRVASKNNELVKKGNVKILTGNFITKRIDKKIDLLITSPPYVTSYEYADLHQLSLLWLDFADDYKIFRKGAIGSMYHNFDFDKHKNKLNKTGMITVEKLLAVDKNRAKNTAKYFIDMQKVIKKSYFLLNNEGYALFIIGNTEYKQIYIDNAKHLAESMITEGYKIITMNKRKISNKFLTPYRDKSGRFTVDKTSRKIYAEEFVVIGRKI